jgi:hypothetical protein
MGVDRIAARRMAEEVPALRSPRAQDRVRLLAIATACAPKIAADATRWWVVIEER